MKHTYFLEAPGNTVVGKSPETDHLFSTVGKK
jgi:hypothetical protein